MKYRTSIVMLILVLLCSVAQAQIFTGITVLTTEKYIEANLELDKVGPLSVGIIGAVDYFTVQSNPAKNFQVDFGDNYVGAYVKIDLAEGPVRPYVAYKPMMANSALDDWFHVWAAGVTLTEVISGVPIGLEWQTCRERGDDDIKDGQLMVTACMRFW